MQDFDQARTLKPDYALAFENRGITLVNVKRRNEALYALSKAIELDPTLWLAFGYRASIYEERSDWRAMYDDAKKLIELAPNYRMGYEYRGRAYLEVAPHQPAITALSTAIPLHPTPLSRS